MIRIISIQGCISFDSYIKPQRFLGRGLAKGRCISFDSYIKPQRGRTPLYRASRCISFDSYIKPQPWEQTNTTQNVVYLLIPTSNHNWQQCFTINNLLYIFWFLHQTTTLCRQFRVRHGCISFDSYIKPQRFAEAKRERSVVYLLIPTSNHNSAGEQWFILRVVYLLIPTSNHNL